MWNLPKEGGREGGNENAGTETGCVGNVVGTVGKEAVGRDAGGDEYTGAMGVVRLSEPSSVGCGAVVVSKTSV